MANPILIELQYLPPLEYFAALMQAERVILEGDEHFMKQTYRNRCYIQNASGKLMLTIPVVRGRSKTKIRELRLDNRQPWARNHWRAIRSSYGNAPFFAYYAPYFEPVFEDPGEMIWDFNKKLLTLCLNLLDMQVDLSESRHFENDPGNGITDLRSTIHPKKERAENSFYEPKSYVQVFGPNFVPNLSIMDLLCCEGPNAKAVLLDSKRAVNI